jgi:glycerol kinase
MKQGYLLSLDQGTTSSRAIIFSTDGMLVAGSQEEFRQIFPRPGWVEHDPGEIWASQYRVMQEAVRKAGIDPKEIRAVGIANQRETVVAWDRDTGKCLNNAIVWQCRRTEPMCVELRRDPDLVRKIREHTGLVLDPYFSATKMRWLLDNSVQVKDAAERGTLALGTVDSWLLWNLTRGRSFATDVTNASRTMLFNITTGTWDAELCERFGINPAYLPDVLNSSAFFGELDEVFFGHRGIPVTGIAGDQQAALFGQACFTRGMVKNTYGTGCFIVINTGEEMTPAPKGLVTTVAWKIGPKPVYAFEGSIFSAGAAVQWLRDEMGLIETAGESEKIAASVPDAGGLYFVPAFVGLGSPYWDASARGTMFGITRGTGRSHVVRAALEAIAYQTRDVIDAAVKEGSVIVEELRADGGASANDFLMQFQADILKAPVVRPLVTETTALGAAFLAGLATEVYGGLDEIADLWKRNREFRPRMDSEDADRSYGLWRRAVERSLEWEER